MCHPLKRERPLSVKAAQEALSEGLAVPSFDSFSIKVAALEPPSENGGCLSTRLFVSHWKGMDSRFNMDFHFSRRRA